MKALVIAENPLCATELCAGARLLADEVVLVTFNSADGAQGADRCFSITVPNECILDDAYFTINALFDQECPGLVFGESSIRILSLIGRLAAHAKTAAIVDVLEISQDAYSTMFFGGAGVRKFKPRGEVCICTARKGTFDGAGATGSCTVEDLDFIMPPNCVSRIERQETPKSEINLPDAEIVFAAGRGFAEKADLDLLYAVKEKTGGEVGCTRPLAEGVCWMPREAYIGVSGQMLNPKVYIGVGLSGQIQHMVGVNRADLVFAINKDKNALLFKQCDYGLIGDIKDVLPALLAEL